MIIDYWPPNHGWGERKRNTVSAFVNMEYKPTEQDILDCMMRALKAANINATLANLRHIYPEYGHGRSTDKFFEADVVLIE